MGLFVGPSGSVRASLSLDASEPVCVVVSLYWSSLIRASLGSQIEKRAESCCSV